MLRASHRVLKPGGTIAFLVIAVCDKITGGRRKEAITAGPPYVDTDLAYPDLMHAAGFGQVEAADVTAEYLETLTAWWRAWDAASAELARIVGDDEFAERQANRMRAIRSVQSGLLCRHLMSGVRV